MNNIKINSQKTNLRGISYMIIATFTFSVFSIAINKISSDLNIILIIAFSTWVSAAIMIIAAAFTKGEMFKHNNKLAYYGLRASFSAIGAILWVQVLKLIPVTEATAISYCTTVINIVMAIILFKEKLTLKKILLIIVAMFGVMMVLRPTFVAYEQGFFLAILTISLWAAGDLMTKKQSTYDKVSTQCLYLFIFMSIIQLPFTIYYWQVPNLYDIIWIIVIGVIQAANIYSLFLAFKSADMVVVAPFDCGRLLFTMIFSYIFYQEKLSSDALIGATILITSLIYLVKLSRS